MQYPCKGCRGLISIKLQSIARSTYTWAKINIILQTLYIGFCSKKSIDPYILESNPLYISKYLFKVLARIIFFLQLIKKLVFGLPWQEFMRLSKYLFLPTNFKTLTIGLLPKVTLILVKTEKGGTLK